MKGLIKGVLVTSGALLALFLIDRFLFNPRPLTTVGAALLTGLGTAMALSALSHVALRTGRASVVMNAWLALASFAFAYVSLDLIFGVLFVKNLSPEHVRDDYVHHRLEPGKVSTITTSEFTYVQRVNDLGLRGAPVSEKEVPNTYRVLMLGDSFTMGYGVPDEATFSSLLEKSLNRESLRGDALHIEVLNGGVDSYAPVLSRLQLERLAPLLSPELIVLSLDMSDLLQEQAYRSIARRDAAGAIVAVPAPQASELGWGDVLTRWIDNHLFITRLILLKLTDNNPRQPTVRSTVMVRNREVLQHTLASDSENRKKQWEDLFESILGIKRFADEHGANFILTIYPWGHQVNDSEWRKGRRAFIRPGSVVSDASREHIMEFANTHGIKLIDMFPAFRRYAGAEPLYHSFDMHWTPVGHRVAARELQAAISEIIQNSARNHDDTDANRHAIAPQR